MIHITWREPDAYSAVKREQKKMCVLPGLLDGLTILRYAHIYRERTSGGVEQYLRLLNGGLLQQNRATILQMHLVRNGITDAIEEERIGLGRIVWVPVSIRGSEWRLTSIASQMSAVYDAVRQCRREVGNEQYGGMPSPLHSLWRHGRALVRYKWAILSDSLHYLMRSYHVDLMALHWLTYDTEALIASAAGAGIPFVLINHFENARFELPQMRKWATEAVAIGMVSDQGVPNNLRERYVNLSDAVDTDFFAPERARPACVPERPIVLLPARIQIGKGHRDSIAAARILKTSGADFALYFVGTVESVSLNRDLRRSVAENGLAGWVRFLGEVTPEEMRDLYAVSSVVVLPSYSEGLPRVLLEAQAMKRPVVAYNSGGTGEALLPNETGFLVDKGNIKELASKVGLILKDEARRLRMGELGRKFVVRRFGVPALVERHERFYLSALRAGLTSRV